MERIVEIERFDNETSYEASLRPSTWDEYIGQGKIKKTSKSLSKPAVVEKRRSITSSFLGLLD